jgi:Ca2+-binding EF-hand superfamily protein
MKKFRAECARRGASGIVGMGRKFRIVDDNGDRKLAQQEFKKCVRECDLTMTDEDIHALFFHLDKDGSGSIDYEEFLCALRGPMNERRIALVNLAFNVLDSDSSGEINPSDIMDLYDATNHPDVLAGKITAHKVMEEFLETFDIGGEVDGKVTRQEFQNYYHNLSMSIDNDDYFELMIRNAWHISGGTGWCANSTNKRVLLTMEDGTEKVVEIENDLGASSSQALQARLRKQDISSQGVTMSMFGGGDYGSTGAPVAHKKAPQNKTFQSQIKFY